jgi:hypothetical protein
MTAMLAILVLEPKQKTAAKAASQLKPYGTLSEGKEMA